MPLHGPPGCGKILSAHAIAHEMDAAFFTISGLEVIHKFLDEIDALLPFRFGWTRRLIQAGRSDAILEVPLPDAPARWGILGIHLARHPVAQDLELGELVDPIDGLSTADLCTALGSV